MRDVYVIGAHTIKFGKYIEKSIKDLAAQTVISCLKEAHLEKKTYRRCGLPIPVGDTARDRTASGRKLRSGRSGLTPFR